MPTLTLKFKEKVIGEYLLEKGSSINIGRNQQNKILIENIAVSGSHAKIDSVGEQFLLTDLQSKNGTFVNEQLVTTHYLQQGDLITIGKHSLAFAYNESESVPDEISDSGMDKTMVMDTKLHRAMMAKISSKQDSSKNNGQVGALSFLSGCTGDGKLEKKLTKIGKDPSSDIVISGMLVGKTSVTISKRPNGYFLSYVGGMAKPKINGKTVKQSVELKEFDMIEIGSGKMQFVFK